MLDASVGSQEQQKVPTDGVCNKYCVPKDPYKI